MIPTGIRTSDRATIVDLCRTHLQTHLKHPQPHFHPCIVYNTYFVKYGDPASLLPQAETQKYVYEQSVDDPNAPRVPRVVEYFVKLPMAYLVMELIDAVGDAGNAHEQVARALRWLRSVPVPQNAKMGAIGGGCARHRIFKGHQAPLLFSSIPALETYMNTALEHIPSSSRPPQMTFSGEKLVFAQADPHHTNFLLDRTGRVCLIDFEAINVLPESFASFALHVDPFGDAFVHRVSDYLEWPPSPNHESMERAACILSGMRDDRLGLDENGCRTRMICV
ncbi:hypothetical protein C8F01DRAFT_1323392 [Mycena amicta]|nr:hypothetical protein C8F01DRAFT_1323392 [Mycena amicta]